MSNLSYRISVRVRDNRSSRNARNLAAFLAQRDEIRNALEDGWTVYQIWETLHAEQKITTSYNAFCSQVNRLIIKREETALPKTKRAYQSPSPPRHAANTAGFTFSSTPLKDEEIL
ncbi:hypothetical protein C8R21_12823 [Nitrosospira multiformis]|uniref:TraK protein n=1 Tax=Nitrosospira multiformis TaxID=1231 RepID=A0A2T5I6F9_9PROT|nr:hypothetical protein C8R21_12823 [Nitrosospira multiformis]